MLGQTPLLPVRRADTRREGEPMMTGEQARERAFQELMETRPCGCTADADRAGRADDRGAFECPECAPLIEAFARCWWDGPHRPGQLDGQRPRSKRRVT